MALASVGQGSPRLLMGHFTAGPSVRTHSPCREMNECGSQREDGVPVSGRPPQRGSPWCSQFRSWGRRNEAAVIITAQFVEGSLETFACCGDEDVVYCNKNASRVPPT